MLPAILRKVPRLRLQRLRIQVSTDIVLYKGGMVCGKDSLAPSDSQPQSWWRSYSRGDAISVEFYRRITDGDPQWLVWEEDFNVD